MRYEFTDDQWAAIEPMLPTSRAAFYGGTTAASFDGLFWVLRSEVPWRDLPGSFGPYTTCYNRFVRWRRAGVWAKIMNTLAGAHEAGVQMMSARPGV